MILISTAALIIVLDVHTKMNDTNNQCEALYLLRGKLGI